jgi:hypothetical protein
MNAFFHRLSGQQPCSPIHLSASDLNRCSTSSLSLQGVTPASIRSRWPITRRFVGAHTEVNFLMSEQRNVL